MKGLNVKRLVSLGVGAALVGSAMAPMVFGAVQLDGLTKAKVIGPSGPLWSVVVGSNAKASDAIWAGNIAAKIANMSNTETAITCSSTGGSGGSATCDTSSAKVTLTVGGTQTISGGARDLITAALSSTAGSKEYQEEVGDAYFAQFKHDATNTRIGSDSNSVTTTEKVGAKVDARFDTSSSIKDLVAYIAGGDMNYTVSYSPGIPVGFTKGSSDSVPIYFLGKRYYVQSVTSNTVVMASEDADKTFAVGESILVKGKDGKDYKVRIDGGGTGTGGTYVMQASLLDGDTVLKGPISFSSGSTVQFTINGVDQLDTGLTLNDIIKNNVNNSDVWTFTILVGSDRLEVRNGRFPYDPNLQQGGYPWGASLQYTSGSLTGITLTNSSQTWDSSRPIYSEAYSFKVNDVATKGVPSADWFTGLEGKAPHLGKVVFKGFYDQGVDFSTVQFLKGTDIADVSGPQQTYGALSYKDAAGVTHSIPYAIRLGGANIAAGSMKFEGIDYTFAVGYGHGANGWTAVGSTNNGNFYIDKGSTAIQDLTTAPDYNKPYAVDGQTANAWTETGDINSNSTNLLVSLEGRNNKTYTYAFKSTQSGSWLVLAGRSPQTTGWNTGVIDTLYNNTGMLYFLGTDVEDDAVSGYLPAGVQIAAGDYNADLNSHAAGVPYYAPFMDEFAGPGSTGGSDPSFKTAVFIVDPLASTARLPTAGALEGAGSNGMYYVYVDTGDSAIVDTASNNRTGYNGSTVAYTFTAANSLTSMSEYTGSSSNYTKAYDDNGVRTDLLARELTFRLPNQAMKAWVQLQSDNVTTTNSGGDPSIDVAVGQTGTTLSGAKITVNSISGVGGTAGGTGGVCTPSSANAVVSLPVGKMVYSDALPPTGNKIIVGGYLVNNAAKNLQLNDGTTIEAALTTSGNYEAQLLASGDIIVAGYTADDTGTAAQKLIDALDALA
jgi:hypothetical protein